MVIKHHLENSASFFGRKKKQTKKNNSHPTTWDISQWSDTTKGFSVILMAVNQPRHV